MALWSVLTMAPLAAAEDAPAVAADSSDQGSAASQRDLVFPVDGEHRFINDWHFPRDGGSRQHKGTDVVAARHTPIVAVTDAVVESIRHSNSGKSGNMVVLRDADGWRYYYMHINNDAFGTDDGSNAWDLAFASGLTVGATVRAGDLVAYVGDSGNAEGTTPHLHFGIKNDRGAWVNPYWSLLAADRIGSGYDFLCRGDQSQPSGAETAPEVGTVRGAAFDRSSLGDIALHEIVDIAAAPTGDGFYLLDVQGRVHAFGDAADHATPDDQSGTSDRVAIATTSGIDGYWVLEGDGRIHAFGDVPDVGSADDGVTAGPVVDFAPVPDGQGFVLVAEDGTVSAAGSAEHHGSLLDLADAAGLRPVAIETTATGAGYWILADNGQVVPFGDASLAGSPDDGPACRWGDLAGPVAVAAGTGVWLIADDPVVSALALTGGGDVFVVPALLLMVAGIVVRFAAALLRQQLSASALAAGR